MLLISLSLRINLDLFFLHTESSFMKIAGVFRFNCALLMLTLSSLSISNSTQAQDRVNRAPMEMKQISNLNDAVGWVQNKAGQWESKKKTIPWRLNEDQKILHTVPEYALGIDNFDEYAFYFATYEGKQFVIFAKHFMEGSYYYPNIRKDWLPKYVTDAYAFNIEELSKLSKLNDGEVNHIAIDAFDFQRVMYSSKAAELAVIAKTIGPLNQKPEKIRLYIDVQPFSEKKITRFQIYNDDKSGNAFHYGGIRDNPYVDSKPLYGSGFAKLFEYCYYELGYDEFTRFLQTTLKLLATKETN
ncbi:hypothetical protein [Undibacterium sp. Di24W]|uniref:hypothetical protein n=1 Tax=Undibacterium sp. Di24W TaxID=3413033 RepID=UPI003BF35C9A